MVNACDIRPEPSNRSTATLLASGHSLDHDGSEVSMPRACRSTPVLRIREAASAQRTGWPVSASGSAGHGHGRPPRLAGRGERPNRRWPRGWVARVEDRLPHFGGYGRPRAEEVTPGRATGCGRVAPVPAGASDGTDGPGPVEGPGPVRHGRVSRCGPTVLAKALPFVTSQLIDQVIAPRMPG